MQFSQRPLGTSKSCGCESPQPFIMNKFTKSLYKLYQSLPADTLPQELITQECVEDDMALVPYSKSKHYTKKEFLDMIQRKDAK